MNEASWPAVPSTNIFQNSSPPLCRLYILSLEHYFFKLFLFPGLRRVRSSPRDFYYMYNIWQDAGTGNQTRAAATAARCATNELHTSLNIISLHISPLQILFLFSYFRGSFSCPVLILVPWTVLHQKMFNLYYMWHVFCKLFWIWKYLQIFFLSSGGQCHVDWHAKTFLNMVSLSPNYLNLKFNFFTRQCYLVLNSK